MGTKKKPEWAPENSGEEFASHVMPGVDGTQSSVHNKKKKAGSKNTLTNDDFVKGILAGDRTVLGRAITLIESNSKKHMDTAQDVLHSILDKTGDSVRIGITGPPGVGKSTFIEALGAMLCDEGHKVAVLAIDPSSSRTKGSILGDKTRMEKLSSHENAFIRPSPSGGTLGGVARKTRETIMVCEAAGYDVILIETIGVGQSEITVRSMVDFFVLLLLPGSGDELQGIKKGVVEIADLLIVNKAEGDYLTRANTTRSQYEQALHYLSPATEGWVTPVMTTSALENKGIGEIWQKAREYIDFTKDTGIFKKRRNDQSLEWVYIMIEEELRQSFYNHPEIISALPVIKKEVLEGNITSTKAVNQLLEKFFK